MHLNFRNVNDAFRNMVTIFQGYVRDQRHMFQIDNGWKPVVAECDMRKAPSRNGNVLMIDEPVTVTYSHPKERVLFNAARDANPFFHLYEALWMLAGRNDVAPLAYYAKQMREYSDDGGTLNGAYGYRWRSQWSEERQSHTDQLQIIINHLKHNPTSRRAVLQMWNVEDDLLKIGGGYCHKCCSYGRRTTEGRVFVATNDPEHENLAECPDCVGTGKWKGSKDVCCNLSVMFSLRPQLGKVEGWYAEKDAAHSWATRKFGTKYQVQHKDGNYEVRPLTYLLDMTVTNRSNDMIWGMLGANYVHFSILQEYVAAHIGVEVGRYNHFTNNLHVYEWNWKPKEWLKAEANQDKYLVGYEYDEPGYTHFPLIQDPKVFDLELSRFVANFDGSDGRVCGAGCWMDPFLEYVGRPMMWAFRHYKEGAFNSALQYCTEIKADDWRVAADAWIRRRMERVQGK